MQNPQTTTPTLKFGQLVQFTRKGKDCLGFFISAMDCIAPKVRVIMFREGEVELKKHVNILPSRLEIVDPKTAQI